jgi:hypothetical protein
MTRWIFKRLLPRLNSAFDQAPVIVTEMKANSLAKILGVPEASMKRYGAH